MIQNSLIEEMPAVSDRNPAPDELRSNPEWLNRKMAPLADSFHQAEPDSLPDTHRVLHNFQNALKSAPAELQSLRCLRTFDFGYAVRHLVVHPNGETVATVGGRQTDASQHIQVWNWRTGEQLFTLTGHTAPIGAIALSQDGTTLVSGSADRTIKVWDWQAGKEIITLQGHNGPVTAIAVSATGSTVISSGCDQYGLRDGHSYGLGRDRAIRVWQVSSGKLTRILSCLTDAPTLAMGAMEKVCLSLEQRPLVLNLDTGETLARFEGEPGDRWLALSDNWQTAALVTGHQIKLKRVNSGQLVCQIALDRRDRAIQVSALSPDGSCFAAGFQRTMLNPKHNNYLMPQNLLRLWDAQTGASWGAIAQSELGQGLWQFIRFSQDSRLLITSVGQTLKIWQ